MTVNIHPVRVIMPTLSATPGQTINVPVKLIGATSAGTPISSANLQIGYNPSVLTYVNLVNFNSRMPVGDWFFSGSSGIVAANWVEPGLDTIAMADSTTLFEVQFTYTGDSTALPFNLAEFTDINFSMVPTTTLTGAVKRMPSLTGPTSVCQESTGNVYVTDAGKTSYQWMVSGGTITSGGGNSDNTVTVTWTDAGNGMVSASYKGSVTKNLMVIVNAMPAPVITGPAYVYSYQGGAQYCTQLIPNHTYVWNVVNGSIVSGQGTNCITVDWGSYPACGCGEVSVCETNTAGSCSKCEILPVVIQAANVFGQITYNNVYETPLNGVVVKLQNMSTSQIIASTVSAAGPGGTAGYYSFNNIPNGTYRILPSSSGTWGGNNATDALIIQLNVIGTYPLYWLRQKAADVNGSLTISGLDALYVKLRTIGSISSYPAGDWMFTDTTITLNSAASVNLKGLCNGDVNASFIPGGFKDASLVDAVEGDLTKVEVNKPFIYRVRSNSISEVGAITLFMQYNQDRYSIDSILSLNDKMRYTIHDGHVAIAWSDPAAVRYDKNDQVISLIMRTKQPVNDPAGIFSVLPGSEFADRNATKYENFELKFDRIVTEETGTGFSMYNYPNPFNSKTNVVYTLPAEGHVQLELTDLYGRVLKTLVNHDQSTDTYRVTIHPQENNLAPGIYFCRIRVVTSTETWVKSIKMIVTQ
jgi:hypothetical protein